MSSFQQSVKSNFNILTSSLNQTQVIQSLKFFTQMGNLQGMVQMDNFLFVPQLYDKIINKILIFHLIDKRSFVNWFIKSGLVQFNNHIIKYKDGFDQNTLKPVNKMKQVIDGLEIIDTTKHKILFFQTELNSINKNIQQNKITLSDFSTKIYESVNSIKIQLNQRQTENLNIGQRLNAQQKETIELSSQMLKLQKDLRYQAKFQQKNILGRITDLDNSISNQITSRFQLDKTIALLKQKDKQNQKKYQLFQQKTEKNFKDNKQVFGRIYEKINTLEQNIQNNKPVGNSKSNETNKLSQQLLQSNVKQQVKKNITKFQSEVNQLKNSNKYYQGMINTSNQQILRNKQKISELQLKSQQSQPKYLKQDDFTKKQAFIKNQINLIKNTNKQNLQQIGAYKSQIQKNQLDISKLQIKLSQQSSLLEGRIQKKFQRIQSQAKIFKSQVDQINKNIKKSTLEQQKLKIIELNEVHKKMKQLQKQIQNNNTNQTNTVQTMKEQQKKLQSLNLLQNKLQIINQSLMQTTKNLNKSVKQKINTLKQSVNKQIISQKLRNQVKYTSYSNKSDKEFKQLSKSIKNLDKSLSQKIENINVQIDKVNDKITNNSFFISKISSQIKNIVQKIQKQKKQIDYIDNQQQRNRKQSEGIKINIYNLDQQILKLKNFTQKSMKTLGKQQIKQKEKSENIQDQVNIARDKTKQIFKQVRNNKVAIRQIKRSIYQINNKDKPKFIIQQANKYYNKPLQFFFKKQNDL